VERDELALAAVLRVWRDRVGPEAAGVVGGGVRRAAGLRREELAELAGISVDYVVRLEQGRATAPSPQVVAALARALQLSVDERNHLYRLAGHAPPPAEISEHVPRGLQRLLHRLETSAGAIFAADWQLIRWNSNWAALLGDPAARPARLRNFARDTFPVGTADPQLSHWPVSSLAQRSVEAAVVADLRRATGRFPGSARLQRLVDELLAGNARFAELWSTGVVGTHEEDRKIVDHPLAGPITVDCNVLHAGEGDLKLVVLTPEPDDRNFGLSVASGPVPTP
jgi:transcriptional regulator with XRE-family HTH domain